MWVVVDGHKIFIPREIEGQGAAAIDAYVMKYLTTVPPAAPVADAEPKETSE